MGALKACPRKYHFSIMLGFRSKSTSVHLTFGILYHGALERYDHFRFAGADHETALDRAVDWALCESWDRELGRPWASDDPNKNRYTLLRSIVWYLDEFPRDSDPLETVILANGKPAVELSFRFESGYTAITGEPYLMCGHLDRIASLEGDHFIADRKTTKSALDEKYFSSFTPNHQFSQYLLAGQIGYALPVKGIIVDAVQIGATFSRYERRQIPRPPGSLEEWHQEWGQWVRLAEGFARAGTWPANEASCGNYGGCEFREICSKAPSVRDEWLRGRFARRIWDPLKTRGDI